MIHCLLLWVARLTVSSRQSRSEQREAHNPPEVQKCEQHTIVALLAVEAVGELQVACGSAALLPHAVEDRYPEAVNDSNLPLLPLIAHPDPRRNNLVRDCLVERYNKGEHARGLLRT